MVSLIRAFLLRASILTPVDKNLTEPLVFGKIKKDMKSGLKALLSALKAFFQVLLIPKEFFWEKTKQIGLKAVSKKGFLKNPLFYFGLSSFVLGLFLFTAPDGAANFVPAAQENYMFAANGESAGNEGLFFNQSGANKRESPDLKITQDGFVYGSSTPRVLTAQTLGAILGESSQENTEVIEYAVQPGDTVDSIAQEFKISKNTILWANNLSGGSMLKAGQTLVILPVSGVAHIVKSGDTTNEVAKTYKAKPEDIVRFNNLADAGDIFVGDILVVPDGVMPSRAPSLSQVALADNFFIFPVEGKVTQGLHWYNAVDVANKCGTAVYAAASGVVQRAKFGWNGGGGNLITILHSNGVVSYYGHLMSIFVKPGDKVEVGDRIGLVGTTGLSTGCHLHFGVSGAKNPLTKYFLGAVIKYAK